MWSLLIFALAFPLLVVPPLGATVVARIIFNFLPLMPRKAKVTISAISVPFGYLVIALLICATPPTVVDNGTQIMGGIMIALLLLVATPPAYFAGKRAVERLILTEDL